MALNFHVLLADINSIATPVLGPPINHLPCSIFATIDRNLINLMALLKRTEKKYFI